MSRGQYPSTRMRRNRMKAFSRRLVSETRLDTCDLIWPLFVIEGDDIIQPVTAMPGVSRYSIDRLLDQAAQAIQLTIPAIAIFPSISAELKDDSGSLARDGDNVQRDRAGERRVEQRDALRHRLRRALLLRLRDGLLERR